VDISYHHLRKITEAEFVDLLKRSTLSERRPIDDTNCIKAMLKHANLLCTAWDDAKLVGIARSVTDFEYCCYLSDRVDSSDPVKAWRKGQNHLVGRPCCGKLLWPCRLRASQISLGGLRQESAGVGEVAVSVSGQLPVPKSGR
jgi:hypothetical protein